MKKIITILIIFLVQESGLKAQDPSFSQFFSSPLNINPGLTGNINADWRAISNFRNQWISPASPYVTGTFSFDTKLQQKMMHVEEGNYFSLGGMLMYDHAMAGVVRSTYASLNGSYRIKLFTNDGYTHRLGLGFGMIYGRRVIDYTRVDFEEQFSGYGFNTNLPTGETALGSMKGYFSSSAGIVYSILSDRSNFDLGVAGFHLNTPKQTFMSDENQNLPARKVVHANFEYMLNDRVILNTNGIYQQQERASYFSAGGGIGYYLGEDESSLLINWGLWYWSKNAVVPYLGLAFDRWQFGLSYDASISKLTRAAAAPSTFELSIILRGTRKPSNVIPCPWK